MKKSPLKKIYCEQCVHYSTEDEGYCKKIDDVANAVSCSAYEKKNRNNYKNLLKLKKRSPLKKHSKNLLAVAKRKTWKLMSEYVRMRDKNKCFTCGSYGNQAGHFIHRDCLDYNEMAINCQCVRCNKWLHGNSAIYAINLIKKYGKKKVDNLILLANKPHPYSIQELEKIQEKLKAMLLIIR